MQELENQINLNDSTTATELSKIFDPLGDGISSIKLVRVSGSDLDIVNAARVSYGKNSIALSERDAQLISFLMKHGHTSPFEHNQLSFYVKAPIYVVREWMRHRMNSFNEISYRFVKAKIEFYVPQYWRFQDEANKQSSIGSFENEKIRTQYKKSLERAYETYEELLQAGVCREQARGLLPVCIYTEFFYTCNLHSLMHFMKLRLSKGAQQEIRAYAYALLKLSQPCFPVSLQEWKRIQMPEIKQEEWDIDFIGNLSNNGK